MKRTLMIAAESMAPPGGWRVNYVPPEMPDLVLPTTGNTPEEVVSVIVKWRVNNGYPANLDDVWSTLNDLWCARAPSRCPDWEPFNSQPAAGFARHILRPLDYGSWVWQYLNTFGVSFDTSRFLSAIEQAKALLDPAGPQNSGCSICAGHFAKALEAFPPDRVADILTASVWVWTVHNLANDHADHPRQSFRKMATKYGWEQLPANQVETIQATLRA